MHWGDFFASVELCIKPLESRRELPTKACCTELTTRGANQKFEEFFREFPLNTVFAAADYEI